jgi:hypothetical protein
MREVSYGALQFTVNGLTKKDFKKHKLSELGFDYYNGPNPENMKDPNVSMDTFLKLCVGEPQVKQLEDLTPKEYKELFLACIRETYGSNDEEKNL